MKYIIEYSDEVWEDLDGGIYHKCIDVPYLNISSQALAHLRKADSVLEEYKKRGQQEAWNAARKIFKMSDEERCRLLKTETETLQESMAYINVEDAFRILEGLKFKPGDEVTYSDGRKAVVTCSFEDTDEGVDVMFSTGETGYTSDVAKLTKTGRHFDIEGILRQMTEG